MTITRTLAAAVLTAAMAGITFTASTTASAQPSGDSGHAIASAKPLHAGVSPNVSISKINRPNQKYVAHTCKFDISGIPDGTMVSALEACGITATFSRPLEKASVDGGTWGTWGSPPDTETATPDVLWLADGGTSVTVTFSSPVRIAGAEVQPDSSGFHPIQATYMRPGGSKKVDLGLYLDGNAGARLLAIKTKNIGSIRFDSDGGFAIAQLRVNLDD